MLSTKMFAVAVVLLMGGMAFSGENIVTIDPLQKRGVSNSDDLARLRHLTMAVGWEFTQTPESVAMLRALGIHKIRCINVDNLPGEFDRDGNYQVDTSRPSRLDVHLKTCTELNAVPHIIVAQTMPSALRIKAEIKDDGVTLMGGGLKSKVCGPTDYRLYRNYWKAYFEYVVLVKGFKNAVFEAFNEPDIGGVICPTPDVPGRGSAELYNIMFTLYANIATAAVEFEQKHGIKIMLGGPALAWAYTFKFGSFNWGERFVRDCAAKKIKLDFIGVHAYGNISSLAGDYPAAYPSFLEMLNSLKKVRDSYMPHTPIQINEWGPSYNTSNQSEAQVNADNVGAAWAMEFLVTMLENGVEDAIYLVATDHISNENGRPVNVWGWPSLMVNPQVFGHPYPKAIGNLFMMISQIHGQRVASTRVGNINTFAVADETHKKIWILVWNFAARLRENATPVDFSIRENVLLKIGRADKFFGSKKVRAICRQINATTANAFDVFQKGQPLTWENTRMAPVDLGIFRIIDNEAGVNCVLSSSSVMLMEIIGE